MAVQKRTLKALEGKEETAVVFAICIVADWFQRLKKKGDKKKRMFFIYYLYKNVAQ